MRTHLLLLLGLQLTSAARADQIKALTRGDHALAAFYQAAASAQKTIDLTTYEFEPCHSAAKVLLDVIVKKAKSGVKVRINTEAYYFRDPRRSQLAAYLAEAGKPDGARESNIELRRFGTSAMIAGDIPRTHSKIFVVDGKGAGATLITGGRNLTDEYFGLSSRVNYLDQDLLVRGAAATDAWKYFNELWESAVKVSPQGDGRAFAQNCLMLNSRDKAVQSWVQGKSAGVLSSRPAYSCAVDFEVDSPRFMERGCGGGISPEGSINSAYAEFLVGECLEKKRTTVQILAFMNRTRSKLQMANQYYFPWGRVRETLDKLREQKKTIEIFTNTGPGLDDMPAHDQAFTCYMQRSGFETFKGTQKVFMLSSFGALRDSWELSPSSAKWRVHTKSAVRDGRDVLVASWNIDPRSYQTNLETGAVVTNCPALASEIAAQYEQLRLTHKADEHCPACQAQFIKAYMKDDAFCGGTPLFY
jgi:putative cardiolipin synthase